MEKKKFYRFYLLFSSSKKDLDSEIKWFKAP